MSILIRQAKIVAPGSTNNNRVMDVLVDGGKITDIKKTISARGNPKIIEAEGLYVSPGWVDLQAAACDPGFEHRETIDSLARASAAGGFTAVCVHSCTSPALDTKSQIEYVLNRSVGKVTEVFPFGTITVGAAGTDLAEMYDMKRSGAVAFSDYKNNLADAGTVMRALQYASNINALIITHCNDHSISKGGHVNEGETAAALGIKAIPALAEELMVERNLSVLRYTGGKIHFPTISTKGSIDLIRRAKAEGLAVTCGVAAISLLLDDSVLEGFNANYKVDPPLRSRKDVLALRTAVENGTIDVIVSDHQPQDLESKELEFDLADNGIINSQTAFSCAFEALKEKNIPNLISCLAVSPRQILGLPKVLVNEGEEANLTIFSTEKQTEFSERNNLSKSRNSPFFDRPLAGRVIGVIRGTKSYFNA